MELELILCIALFATTCGALLLGFPVAFTLAGVSFLFGMAAWALFGIDMTIVSGFPQRILAIAQNDTLLAVPLFIFMGVMLERSRVADELLDNMGRAFGRLRGGLAISVCMVGTLLAASTGIVGATVVTMGLLALPTMLRRGYSTRLSSGTIAAAGTLGQIIPPSIVLVLLGDQLSTAYQTAQFRLGNFSPDSVSVNDLFAGALFPGLVLVGMYVAYIVVVAFLKPAIAPAIPPGPDMLAVKRTSRGRAFAIVPAVLIGTAVTIVVLNRFAPTGIADGFAMTTAMMALLMTFGLHLDPTNRRPLLVGTAGLALFVTLAWGVGASLRPPWLLIYLALLAAMTYGAFAHAWRDAFWGPILRSLVPPLALIMAVLGSILGGLASPTEAAGVGALGAIMLAGYRVAPDRGQPILAGVVALMGMLLLTIHVDLRMQRTVVSAGEWIAIGMAFVLAAILAWGVVAAVLRTLAYMPSPDGTIRHFPEGENRHWETLALLAIMVGALLAMAFGALWLLGVMAVVIGGWSLLVLHRRRSEPSSVLADVVRQTLDITVMVFAILIGASMFSLVFRAFGGDVYVENFLLDLPGGAFSAVLVVMLVMFLLGFFLDFLEIVFIVVPIVAPVLLQLEFGGEPMNPVWLGVMMAVNLQTSYLTPPFGFALFYLRGVAPDAIRTTDIYRGVIPFVLVQLLALVVLWTFPGLATWLPSAIYGS